MGVRNDNSTDYVHPDEPNLLNLHKAMQYNANGEPEIRTVTGITGNIIIEGNVNIPGNVEVFSSPDNPVHTHITEIGNSGILTVPFMPIDGNVFITGGNLTFDNTTIEVTQGTIPWSVFGNVEANITGGNLFANVTGSNVNIDSMPPITGNVEANITGGNIFANVTQGTDPWNISGNVGITGTSTVTLGTGATDAFGRLRVSEPYTLFDSKARYYDHNDFSSSTSTGGTVVYQTNSSTFELNVTSANGSSVIRETKRVFPYQPGKSLLILATFCMNTPKPNLRQRVGYFTTNNGIYFENDGEFNYMVIRSYSSGALVEDRIRQDNWDNPFPALHVDRTQIFWCDVEWLGVGSIRCGFVINGAYVLCHTFHHANVTDNTNTYMTTATLPIRYEITNTAGTTGASMFRQICSTVISEGGYNAFTYSETAGRGLSVLRLTTAGTYYPLVSIRLASTRLDSIVLPRQVDILSPTVNYYRWALVINPTLTGATWAGTSSTGTVEYDIAATDVSGGIELQAGYVSSRELSQLGAGEFAFQLGRTLAGVSDVVSLVISSTSNNADVLGQLGWQEVT